ncbi:hypothetical protein [Niveispirillum sp. KHB5.9]|uniref:hypothetical protein n=1 Tax=Niveispirillum sp. KHB5.9 TaxID=3400269 RepID=UPI003A872904
MTLQGLLFGAGAAPLTLSGLADVPSPGLLTDGFLPLALDGNETRRAYVRMLQACAMPCSFVRLTRVGPGGRQWLTLRLDLLDGTLLDRAVLDDIILPADVLTAARTGFGDPPDIDTLRRVGLLPAAAEMRDFRQRRRSYLSLGFSSEGGRPSFESIAVNASAPAVMGSAFGFQDIRIPDGTQRIADVAALRDGFWWASTPDMVVQDPASARLTLAQALGRLRIDGGGVPITLTRLEASGQPVAAQLPILDVAGLRAAPVPTGQGPIGVAGAYPYHHLAMVLDGFGLQWQRWGALAGVHKATLATPILVLVRGKAVPDQPQTDEGVRNQPTTITIEGLTDSHVADLWNRTVLQELRRTAKNRLGTITLLPEFADTRETAAMGRWRLTFHYEDTGVAGGPLGRYRVTGAELAPIDPTQINKDGSWTLSGTTLRFADLRTKEQGPAGPVSLAFGGDVTCTLTPEPDKDGKRLLRFEIPQNGPWHLKTPHGIKTPDRVSVTSPTVGVKASSVAIGGLDFSFPADGIDFNLNVTIDGDGLAYKVIGSLPVRDVMIGGTDLIRNFGDEPLIWAGQLSGSGQLEVTDARQDMDGKQQVKFKLISDGGRQGLAGRGRCEVVIIDPSPMMAVQVGTYTLDGAGAAGRGEATWQADEGVWRLTPPDGDGHSEVTIVLPPQGVAEGWERAKSGQEQLRDQVAEGKPVPARFGPTTQLIIEGAEHAQNPVAPWNLRHIMGHSANSQPGSRLLRIGRMEVLYGLEAWTGELKGLRLAEIAGWRGEPRELPPVVGEGEKNDKRRQLWNAARITWSRRLAVLDVRDGNDRTVRPRISPVRYRIRSKQAGDEVKYAWPLAATPPDDAFWTLPRDGGITSGVFAGFEQPSVLQSLKGRRDGEGEIDGLQLSALGAWTRPTASFQKGLSVISCDVQMGRVQEARFERKGRIAGLHHLAKHVIVYRRAFVPSRQFAHAQDHLVGRPIVRKFEEYIEITQPLRRYPDRLSGGTLDAGAVLGARFRTIRINVNGAWASPLAAGGIEGYSLPLWNPDDDQRLYPRPATELLVAGDADQGKGEPSARRVENPDRLRFYSITGFKPQAVTDGALLKQRDLAEDEKEWPPGNVEEWPLVYGQDHIDRAGDMPTNGSTLNKDDFNRTDPAPLDAAGLEAFTLRLEPGPLVNLMHGRATKPVMADLRSVVMMRSAQPAQATATSPELAEMAKAAGSVAGLDLLARNATGAAMGLDEVRAKAIAHLDQLKTITLPNVDGAQRQFCAWAHQPAEQVRKLSGEMKRVQGLGELWRRDRDGALAVLQSIHAMIGMILPIDQTVSRIFTPVSGEAVQAVGTLCGEFEKSVTSLKESVERAVEQTDSALSRLRTGIDGIIGSAAGVQAHIATWDRELADRIRTYDARLEALSKALDGFADAGRQLRVLASRFSNGTATADRILGDLATRVEQARARLAGLLKQGGAEGKRRLAAARNRLAALGRDGSDTVDAWKAELAACRNHIDATARAVREGWEEAYNDAEAQWKQHKAALIAEVKAASKALTDTAGEALPGQLRDLDRALRLIDNLIIDLRLAETGADAIAASIEEKVTACITLTDKVAVTLEQVGTSICAKLTDNAVTDLIGHWGGKIDALKAAVVGATQIDDVLKRIAEQAGTISATIDHLRSGVEARIDAELKKLPRPASQGAAEAVALNLLRAAGAPPIIEQLAFNREQVAYYFNSKLNRVIVTPMTALVDQAGQSLRSLGISLPTLGLEERLLNPLDDAFADLRSKLPLKDLEYKAQEILKDFAGLKDMLPNLQFDSDMARAIKISHDLDPIRNIASLEAKLEFGPRNEDLFRSDGFAIVANDMHLEGVVKLGGIGPSQQGGGSAGEESRSVRATLKSNWDLHIGGVKLLRIRDTSIQYDQKGGLTFDVDPSKIEFPGVLQLLTTALNQYGNKSDGPLTREVINDPDSGLPIGLKCMYDLPATSFGAGAVAVMNASLGVHVELAQRSEFEIRSFAYFGRRDQPFAMTVSFLGGGGYLEAEAVHLPASRRTDMVLRLSLGLCAGTGFSLGPLNGQVTIFLGLEANFHSGSSGSQLVIAAVFVIAGSVTAWGFVTLCIGVTLRLTYENDRAVGYGSISVTVKVSRFFKKSFSRNIRYMP